MKIKNYLTLLGSLILLSCHCGKTVTSASVTTSVVNKDIQVTRGAKAIVYKTVKDYSQYVPVTMNAQKTKIISCPAPSDVYYKGELAIPTKLKNGYLLDNRGINENVAFLSYTYKKYSQLKEIPSAEELMSKILDNNPLTELWNCGDRSQYKDEIKDVNTLIDTGFPGCKKAKIFRMTL